MKEYTERNGRLMIVTTQKSGLYRNRLANIYCLHVECMHIICIYICTVLSGKSDMIGFVHTRFTKHSQFSDISVATFINHMHTVK